MPSTQSYPTFAAMFAMLLSFLIFSAGLLHAGEYKGPLELKGTNDGAFLYVMNHDADEIAVITTVEGKVARTIKTAKQPNGFVLATDEKTVYTTCGGYRGVVQAIDAASGKVVKEIPAGHTPYGPSVSPDGTKLFVCNRFNATVLEYALPDMTPLRTFKVVREPRKSLVTPDGKTLFVTNFLPNDPNNYPDDPDAPIDISCEIAAIDLATGEMKNIRLTNGSHSLHGLAISPDGKYIFVTQILARYQLPTSQLDRGWINTNGLGIIDVEKKTWYNTVLLDDIDRGAANPWGVAVSKDGTKIFVALAGTHEVAVIEAGPMLAKLAAISGESGADGAPQGGYGGVSKTADDVPNDLAFLVGMKKRLKLTGLGPRELAVVGNDLYVGQYYSDSVQKITFPENANPKLTEIPVGPPPAMDDVRKGDLAWNDASTCFQAWLSCASCHPDARTDALNWDLLNDGIGNPKNAKSLLLCSKCPPAMWHGVRPSSSFGIRTGYRFILFTEPVEETCNQADAYLQSLTPLESPYLVDGKLSEKALRGKVLFEGDKLGCARCHPAESHFTDMKLHDVNSKTYFDRRADFDTPSLIECWRTAPYMHDGRHPDMKDVFLKSRHGDVYWKTDPTEEEIDDLVEYVLSL